jgi:hypothetical protein
MMNLSSRHGVRYKVIVPHSLWVKNMEEKYDVEGQPLRGQEEDPTSWQHIWSEIV